MANSVLAILSSVLLVLFNDNFCIATTGAPVRIGTAIQASKQLRVLSYESHTDRPNRW